MRPYFLSFFEQVCIANLQESFKIVVLASQTESTQKTIMDVRRINNIEMQQIIKVALVLLPVWCLVPIGPIELSPNTENSPSVYLFPFKLSRSLPQTGYLLITMPNYQTAVTPTSCKLVNTSVTLDCTNFQTPTLTGLTVTASSMATPAPNINPMLTVLVRSDTALAASTNYYLQVVLSNVIPSTNTLSDSFEFYSVSFNSIIYEQNWNFGQVMYQIRQTNSLTINNLVSLTSVLPGTTSILQASVTINIAVTSTYSRLKIVLQDPFTFRQSSRMTTYNDPLYTTNGNPLYIAPTILNTNVLTPNVLITTFSQSFAVGRKFTMEIKDIQSPFTRSSAYFSFYSLPFNSNNPYESNELNLAIATTYFPLTVSLGLPQSMPISSDPIQLYQGLEQYIVISVSANQDIPAGYALYLSIPAASIIQGTAFANTSTTNTTQAVYNFTTNTILVSGFGQIASGATIQVSCKATVTGASVQVFASIDLYSRTFPVASPLFSGSSSTYTAVVPATFMTSFYCNGSAGGETTWNLYSMNGTASNIQFTVQANDSSTGSFLDVYMSSFVSTATSFSNTSSCLLSSVGSVPCAVKIFSTYLNIQINSSSISNYFPINTAVVVTINDLKYVAASSHSNYIYPFFFKFTRSEAVGSITYSWMYTPNVLPQRNQMVSSFYLTYSNEIPNAGVYYPNILRLHSTLPSAWNFVKQANEVRVITVLQSLGFRSTIAVPDLNSYPCASNIGVTCKYTKGETDTTLTQKTVLDWDRIDIFLEGDEVNKAFHVIIPDIFTSSTTSFEVLVGKYNTISRQYLYQYMEATLTLYLGSYGVTIASKTQVNATLLQLQGKAGSYASSIQADIKPVGSAYALSGASGIFIVSTWELFNSQSFLASLINNNSMTSFGIDNNAPLFLALNSANYLTFIPFAGTSAAFTFYLKSLHLPYTYDLPYYSIFLTDTNGVVDSYDEFINKNAGVFYYSVLLGLSITCMDNSVGVNNTACFINFNNNHEIIRNGKIYVQFSGMTISTNLCYLTYTTSLVSNTSIPVTCSSASNQTVLVVSLPGTSGPNYPNSNQPAYQLVVYGVSILESSISQSITLTLRDNSGGYIIQTGTRLLTTTVANALTIAINQITYQFNNPLSKSSMFVLFTLPRSLYLDETFLMIMGKDLSDANTFISKIHIVLADQTGSVIETIQSLSTISYEISFTVTNPSLIVAGSYTLKIYGLQIPSSNTNDIFYIVYKRNFDGLYALANDQSTTAPFPTVTSRINSLITVETLFNTEGLEQQINFNITHNNTNVDSNTTWYVNLPIYYTPTVWNDNTMVYCEISGATLPCSIDPNVPYQVVITNSPRIINNGTLYTISIFGVPCPRKTYLNGNASYVNEYIFLGVASNSSSSYYVEYTQIYPNQLITDPPSIASFGMIKVGNVLSSSMNCFSNTYMKITMYTSVAIAAGTTLLITFPKEFNNFHDIGLDVHILAGSTNIRQGTCNVVNRRVEVTMGTGSIPAATSFVVEFTNLPTPELAGVTDMNEMSVVVISANNSTTTAASSVRTNEAPQLAFVANPKYISFNSDNTLVVTAGTYTAPISITSSDGQMFLSNVLVNFTAAGFNFIQNPTSIYLGATSQTFVVGADVSLMPTFYVYNVIKTQNSLSPYYTVLTNNNIQVTNTQVVVTVPSTINVPKGGCSLPIKVSIANPPYTDVSINFVYNNSKYSSDIFWINPETTNSFLNFSLTQTYQWISFCSAANITYTTVPITLALSGTNYLSYSLTSTALAVSIQAGVANTTPALVLNPVNTLKTVAVYNFTTNTNGFIFYSLTLGSNVPPMDILSLKVEVKNMNLTLEAQSDFLSRIYTADRDHRVNMIPASTGNNQITFSNLLPQKSYTLCAYFESQFGINTDAVCQTFSTLVWGVVSKAALKFTRTLNSSEVNNVLCFFVKEVSAKIINIVDLMGSSCSLSSSPQNYYYKYPGSTFSYESTGTTVYLIANAEVTTDASITSFRNMFDATNSSLTATSFSDALGGFSINYISSGVYAGNFDPVSAQNGASGFTQSIFFDTPYYSSGVVTVPNVRLDKLGSVYFILQIQKQIYYNALTGEANITIRMDYPPTVEQIFNCQDWNGAAVVGCARAVLNSASESISITFSGILTNSFYKLYYTSANEYPLRPVSDGTVESATVTTTIHGTRILGSLLLAVSLLLM